MVIVAIGENLVEILKSSVRNDPLISFILGLLILIAPFLWAPWVVSREHNISYRTAMMNLWVWLFRDRTEARLLRLAHEERDDNK